MSTAIAPLTGQDRVNRAFNREEQDRIPRHETFWPQTIERWQSEGLDGDYETLLDMLQSDFGRVTWLWPAPFPGRNDVLEEDEETIVSINPWGQTERNFKKRAGTPEHLGFSCLDRDTWEKEIKPKMVAHPCHLDIEACKALYARERAKQRWTFFAGVESFEQTRRLMGDEITLIAMAEDPDWVADVSRTHVDIMIRDLQQAIDAGVKADGMWIYGDMAFNHATMCSPAMYRAMIWPDHKRMADFAHANGMKMIYHTDGDVNGVVPMYIEAGFDALQPLEAKANMDVRQLCTDYGDKLGFIGNIDVMIMATNDRAKIEQEIASKLEAGKATRGYCYHSDHSVPPSVTWETYRFIMECVERYGNYD